MTKLILVIVAIVLARVAEANIFLGEGNRNQFGFYLGGGDNRELNRNSAPVFMAAHYAQSTEFFRLPARILLEVAAVAGGGEEWGMAGGALEVALVSWRGLYFGVGLGGHMRDRVTSRLDSKFTFSQKAFIGYGITDSFAMELFARHISNGTLSERNAGYNFFGLSALVNF